MQRKIKGIYCLTAEHRAGFSYEDMAAQACKGGAGIIQLRAKSMTDIEIYETGKKILLITKENGALFILDDRLDIALAVNADGVHLGQDDLPLGEAKKIASAARGGREDFIIGYSTHSVKQALEAAAAGAGYISIGPIFATPTKPLNPLGTGVITEIKKHIKIPVVAIGGINAENISGVMAAGADAAAVIRAGCGAVAQIDNGKAVPRSEAENVREAVAELKRRAVQ